MEIEFVHQDISFISLPEIQLEYRNKLRKQYFKPDFICFGKIILEIKAVPNLIDEQRSQTLNYSNATSFDLALLVNFGHYPKIERERIGNRKNYKNIRNELNNLTDNN